MNPARIRILAVGKVRKGWVQEGIALYRRRLPGLEIAELKDSTMVKEAEAISAALRPEERLVVLTEEGRTLDSLAFAEQLRGSGSERIAFVIGGADGLEPSLKAQAHWRLSLSPLTFPHELARLL
ncbi:MAG: 23S rRNA (pseudouridine(1915)-N(3))-methyltransferase RlmH, partial [Cyanobium sp. MAG_185]|nr:23S rRNA (pseudouridine(1915)-N(3))-methyltransferase RlmH [Cyanobium sp. MAG_185]